ncbi:DinB family protein [Aquimarina sp. 2304DJ70-9]|uniref:DinB family protein n=1 Tax=Aquimarina penaris TaxID=3231044 RepID=UPI003462AED0
MTTKELVKKWKGNKRYTLKFIEMMPEEHFDFKPVDGMKTFQSQISHITSWLRTHSRFVTGIEFPKVRTSSKEMVFDALENFFNTFIASLETLTTEQLTEVVDVWYGKTTRYQIANVMDNHLSHHRGQMVVYLRLAGHKPPSYIGW